MSATDVAHVRVASGCTSGWIGSGEIANVQVSALCVRVVRVVRVKINYCVESIYKGFRGRDSVEQIRSVTLTYLTDVTSDNSDMSLSTSRDQYLGGLNRW